MTAGGWLRALLLLNAVGSLMATVVLMVVPAALPATIGILLAPDQHPIARLLGAAELAIATVCIATLYRPSRDRVAPCVAMLVVFHVGSIAAEVAALAAHRNIVVAANIAVRTAIVLALLGVYYAYRREARGGSGWTRP